jgi:hypothetical protein
MVLTLATGRMSSETKISQTFVCDIGDRAKTYKG